jgi:two-component system sensor histidine kinase KdpD
MAKGQLRVYLGAAPGVGKTYKMLEEGHRRRDRGTDVVVGYVETHGRKHTEAMLAGLEVVPRKHISYRGSQFEEMDVDAVLDRRPAVGRRRRLRPHLDQRVEPGSGERRRHARRPGAGQQP